MGSSGGGYFYEPQSSEDILKKLDVERKKLNDPEFDRNVDDLIKNLLVSVNDRDTDSIQRHLNEIRKSLESEIAGTLDLRYAGSVAKHTYVDGLSDIDTLAILNKSELKNMSPLEVKSYFFEKLKKRFPKTEIISGNLAVTMKFSDGKEIQLLPAVKTNSGIKISSTDGKVWSPIIKPEKFVVALRAMNTQMSGKAIPVIKLAKSIIGQQPEKRRLSGYHVEALAIEVFAHYKGEKTVKAMLKTLFKEGGSKILKPLKDRTGQSTHVDDYLGGADSLSRRIVSDSFNVLSKRMESADSTKMIKVWSDLLN